MSVSSGWVGRRIEGHRRSLPTSVDIVLHNLVEVLQLCKQRRQVTANPTDTTTRILVKDHLVRELR
jgi:hypothetical protein